MDEFMKRLDLGEKRKALLRDLKWTIVDDDDQMGPGAIQGWREGGSLPEIGVRVSTGPGLPDDNAGLLAIVVADALTLIGRKLRETEPDTPG